MTDELREPPRQVAHFFLLVAVAFAIILSALVSRRPVLLASFNNVAPAVGAVPQALIPDYGNDWSVIIRRSDWNPLMAGLLSRTGEGRSARLGWIVREWSFLSLPLVAYRQGDIATFREDGYGYRLAGLTPEQAQAIAQGPGTPWFPWWRYAWGWLAVLAVATFGWAELRWQARRRAALGVL